MITNIHVMFIRVRLLNVSASLPPSELAETRPCSLAGRSVPSLLLHSATSPGEGTLGLEHNMARGNQREVVSISLLVPNLAQFPFAELSSAVPFCLQAREKVRLTSYKNG